MENKRFQGELYNKIKESIKERYSAQKRKFRECLYEILFYVKDSNDQFFSFIEAELRKVIFSKPF